MISFSMIETVTGDDRHSLQRVRELLDDYARALDFDLCFQDFAQELAALPGPYAPPPGRLLLAMTDGQASGCVALKPISETVCEMKRLYVRPCFRRRGLGRRLARRIIRTARDTGYSAIRLDTIPSAMPAATALYESLGFEPIGAYLFNPIPGAAYYERSLEGVEPSSPESDDLCLRVCEPSDVAAVHRLIHGTIDACYPAVYAPEAVQFFKQYHSTEAVAERVRNAHTILAERNERIVATGSLAGEHITAVFVSPSSQRGGIGAAIMKYLEGCASSKGIRLLTLDASVPSKRFYTALGYVMVEEASLPVANGKTLDFYRMRKSLP